MLVDEEHVLLEAGVEVGFEAELSDDGVVVAVNVGVDAVHALEDLADQGGEGLGEGHADAAGHDGLVVDAALDPRHELFDVGWRRHLGGPLEVLVVLPQILEPARMSVPVVLERRMGNGPGLGRLTRRLPSFPDMTVASRTL